MALPSSLTFTPKRLPVHSLLVLSWLPYYGDFEGQQSLEPEVKHQTINGTPTLASLPVAGYDAIQVFTSPVSINGTEITRDPATASLPANLAGGAYVIRATVSKADDNAGHSLLLDQARWEPPAAREMAWGERRLMPKMLRCAFDVPHPRCPRSRPPGGCLPHTPEYNPSYFPNPGQGSQSGPQRCREDGPDSRTRAGLGATTQVKKSIKSIQIRRIHLKYIYISIIL